MMPKGLVRRLSAPYIAGEELGQAETVIRALASGGMGSTLDVLGEAISTADEARQTRDHYLDALDRLSKLGNPDLINVSVKLTAFGLGLDRALCTELVTSIVERADEYGGFVRIDMEDTPWTDATLDLVNALRGEGYDDVGAVVQAYLRRTPADVAALAASKTPVRMVKGIYIEPDELAFRAMPDINAAFIEQSRVLAQAGCRIAFATHCDDVIKGCLGIVEELNLPKSQYEFQMLLGVREDRRDALVKAGHPMRVYVPFGARWYEYSLRRLRENPRVAGHVAKDIVGTFGRRLKRQGASMTSGRFSK
jgi:proline dehydrogenase